MENNVLQGGRRLFRPTALVSVSTSSQTNIILFTPRDRANKLKARVILFAVWDIVVLFL